MYTMVHSAKYNNAPMPHAIFFYGQYAIHGTNAVGALGQSGVARLHKAFAGNTPRLLFGLVQSEGAVYPMSRAKAPVSMSLTPAAPRARRSPTRRLPTSDRSRNGPAIRPAAERPKARHADATFVSHGTPEARGAAKRLIRRVFAGRLFRRLALSGRRPGFIEETIGAET